MISLCIGKIPEKLHTFFEPLRRHVRTPVFRHLWGYVLALAVTTGRRDVKTLHRWLPDGPCRQNVTDFLIAAPWDAAAALRAAILEVVTTARPKPGRRLYLILDGSKAAKRGKKMEGAHKFYVPMGGRAAWGHQFLLGALEFEGKTVPLGVELYAPKAFVRSAKGRKLGLEPQTLNDLAAKIIREFPQEWVDLYEVVVLFDAGFFNETVTSACEERGLTYVGRAPKNRVFYPDHYRGKRDLGRYGPGVLRYEGREVRLRGAKGTTRYRVAQRDGRMRTVGRVRVVFSRRLSDGGTAYLVTNNFEFSARDVVEAYTHRWSIEVLIKLLKQRLGLGDYQTGSFTGVLRHLHMVCLAHLALTHLGLKASRHAKATAKTTTPLQPSIQALQDQLRGLVWQDHAKRFRRRKNGHAIIHAIEEVMPKRKAA